jgi:hypothetical protein
MNKRSYRKYSTHRDRKFACDDQWVIKEIRREKLLESNENENTAYQNL